MPKRESIKQRSIYVYLPSLEMVEDWKAKANKGKVSISQFVIEHVTNSITQEEGEEAYKPRAELLQKLREKDEQIEKLTREGEVLKLALERVEGELRRYRAEPFLDEGFRGIRGYDKRLIELLKKGEAVDSDHLLHLLKIDPRETTLTKAVSKELENLEAYGLVEKTRRGWKWTSK
jgi:flagellar motility protein MotE (MotC chaperone)